MAKRGSLSAEWCKTVYNLSVDLESAVSLGWEAEQDIPGETLPVILKNSYNLSGCACPHRIYMFVKVNKKGKISSVTYSTAGFYGFPPTKTFFKMENVNEKEIEKIIGDICKFAK